jgi:hypothetical protein
MGAGSSVENTPNAPEFICTICLPKPKSYFNEKRLHWASVVRGLIHFEAKMLISNVDIRVAMGLKK